MKRLQKKCLKWLSDWKNIIVPGLIMVGIVATFTMKRPAMADGDSAAKGALFGGLSGAAIGGIAGGGKGAGIGLGAGLVGGAIFGGAMGSDRGYNPYREREKLQRRLARTRDPRKQAELQAQINDINMRLVPQGGAQPAYPRPTGY